MKKAVGIIAEYNPFHNGHAYQIKKAKELTGAEYAVVIMSGDFVQRGTPALLPKHERAKLALLGGADIVLELPSYFASASAEYFAKGAVGILDALRCIDFLCFGSESGELSDCLSLAKILTDEPSEYQTALRQQLKNGLSFPTARKNALSLYCQKRGNLFDTSLLDTPNNILGIEYCKALLTLNSTIQPITIKRKGNDYHSTDISHTLSSASAIRSVLLKNVGSADISALLTHTMPKTTAKYFESLLPTQPLLTEDDFSLLLKYRLMQHTPATLCKYADLSEDLARRIYNNLNDFRSFSQFAELLKTKELTRTRINRALLHAILGIFEDMPTSMPSYVRLLGFRKESSSILRTIQNNTRLPLITKAADYRKLLSCEEVFRGESTFEKDLFVSNLYESVKCAKKQTGFVNDLQKPPVILCN